MLGGGGGGGAGVSGPTRNSLPCVVQVRTHHSAYTIAQSTNGPWSVAPILNVLVLHFVFVPTLASWQSPLTRRYSRDRNQSSPVLRLPHSSV